MRPSQRHLLVNSVREGLARVSSRVLVSLSYQVRAPFPRLVYTRTWEEEKEQFAGEERARGRYRKKCKKKRKKISISAYTEQKRVAVLKMHFQGDDRHAGVTRGPAGECSSPEV